MQKSRKPSEKSQNKKSPAKGPDKIAFIRHGIAADAADYAGEDAERPLTKEGKKEVKVVAKKLAELFHPDLIITSDLIRAKQTAEICLKALKGGKRGKVELLETEQLRPEVTTDQWHRFMAKKGAPQSSKRSILIIGHQPNQAQILQSYLTSEDLQLDWKKAGLAIIEKDGPKSWALSAFVPPKFWDI